MRIRGSRKAGIAGIVIGLFLGLLGMVSGVYMGVVKPAMDAGASIDLPVISIVVMLSIMLFVVVMAVILLRKRKSAANLDDKWK